MQTPWMQTPWMQTPLDADPPPLDADPPDADPLVNRMAHRCKNITLPQTSFAGSKKYSCWKRLKLKPRVGYWNSRNS